MMWIQMIAAGLAAGVALRVSFHAIFVDRDDVQDAGAAWFTPAVIHFLEGQYIEGEMQARKFAVWIGIGGFWGAIAYVVVGILF